MSLISGTPGPERSGLGRNENHAALPGGSKNNRHEEQTKKLHQSVSLNADWKRAGSLFFPRCDSSPSCPQNMSLLDKYAGGRAPAWRNPHSNVLYACVSDGGVLGYFARLRGGGGLSGGPVTTAPQTLRCSVSRPPRGPAG